MTGDIMYGLYVAQITIINTGDIMYGPYVAQITIINDRGYYVWSLCVCGTDNYN